MFIDFRKRDIEGETEGDRQTSIWQKNINWLPPPYVPQPGIEPTTQVCALSRDHSCNLLVYWKTLQPVELPGQDQAYF